MRAEEFDQKFLWRRRRDRGPGPRRDPPSRTGAAPDQRRFPVVDDRIAGPGSRRLGVTRQSIIKVWIAKRLERGTTAA